MSVFLPLEGLGWWGRIITPGDRIPFRHLYVLPLSRWRTKRFPRLNRAVSGFLMTLEISIQIVIRFAYADVLSNVSGHKGGNGGRSGKCGDRSIPRVYRPL